jgi:hypothetical protein
MGADARMSDVLQTARLSGQKRAELIQPGRVWRQSGGALGGPATGAPADEEILGRLWRAGVAPGTGPLKAVYSARKRREAQERDERQRAERDEHSIPGKIRQLVPFEDTWG